MQLKLTKQYIDLIALVHGRKGTHVSETAIEKAFDMGLFSEEELKDPIRINNKLEALASVNIFPGAWEQNGAIIALTNLALEHKLLLNPAIETLRNISTSNHALQTHCIVRLVQKKVNDSIIPFDLGYQQQFNANKKQNTTD
nr:hypothetical protein [uncultured Allomuricauda sp.]